MNTILSPVNDGYSGINGLTGEPPIAPDNYIGNILDVQPLSSDGYLTLSADTGHMVIEIGNCSNHAARIDA